MEILILVGPPCSGKSTWAKNFLSLNPGYVRINRDELRIMLRGRYSFGEQVIESTINNLVEEIAKSCTDLGLNLIIDATHCKVKYIEEVKRACTKGFTLSNKMKTSIHFTYKIFDETSFAKQRRRNFFRWIKTGIWIPQEVSKIMNRNLIATLVKIRGGHL